jgi:hypothetical protein
MEGGTAQEERARANPGQSRLDRVGHRPIWIFARETTNQNTAVGATQTGAQSVRQCANVCALVATKP